MRWIIFIAGLVLCVSGRAQDWEFNPFTGKLDKTNSSKVTTLDSRSDSARSELNILNTAFQDSLGWFNVKSYGAVGDGVTNDQLAVQAAIDAADDYGTVVVPIGTFIVDSITLKGSQILRGVATGLGTNASIIKGSKNKPVIHVYADDGAGSYGVMYETKIENLVIKGSESADSSSQHGIVVNGSARLVVRDVFIYGVGGYGVYLASLFDTDVARFDNVTAQHCRAGGVKMDGSNQINAVTFDKCHFIQNYGPGMGIAGNNVNIQNNIIQGNDSAGILVSNFAVGATSGITNVTITGNYTEYNGGGSVYAEMGLAGGQTYAISDLVIKDNYFRDGDNYIDKPEVDACVTLTRGPGSSAVFYFYNVEIGNNHYTSTSIYNVDGNSVLNEDTYVFVNDDGITEYNGISGAVVEEHGSVASPYKIIAPTAANGITQAMLGPNLLSYWTGGTDTIDITADPQIAAGYDGQEIWIFQGGAAGKAIQFDDGDGIDTADEGSVTISLGEGIGFRYHSFLGSWREIWRNDQ